MAIYCFTFPIPDDYGEGVVYKRVYFESDTCPSHTQVVEKLYWLAEEKMGYSGGSCEYADCYKAAKNIKDGAKLPCLYNAMIRDNVFCEVRGESYPISVELVKPIKI